MKEESNVEKLFVRALILVPLLYIGLGWCIGLNYGCKPLVFGPYPDIPVAVRTGLLIFGRYLRLKSHHDGCTDK